MPPLPRSDCFSHVSHKETRHIETIFAAIIGIAVILTPVPTKELQYSRAQADEIPFHALELTPPEPLEEKADRIADAWGVPREKLRNLVTHESQWNPKAVGDSGHARGLVQIHDVFFPNVTEEQAFDPEFALNFAAQAISEGKEHKWTVCNCYSLVRSKYPFLPPMAAVQPSGLPPAVGGVAIFYYSGVKHVALITDVAANGFWVFESNYEPCKVGSRFIHFDDPKFAGTWFPG